MAFVSQACTRLRRNSNDTHCTHQALYTFPVNLMALCLQSCRHLTASVKRRSSILLVNQLHDVQVLSTFLCRVSLVVPTGSIKP